MVFESRKATSLSVIFGFLSFVVYFIFQQTFQLRQNEKSFPYKMPLINNLKSSKNGTFSRNTYVAVTNTWQVVFAYQWLWCLYCLLTLCRREALAILPAHFYIAWSISSYFEIGQLLLLDEGSVIWAWICACSAVICRHGCLFIAFVGLFEYLAAHTGKYRAANAFDVWCHRILVQNGLLVFQAWSSTAVCINFGANLTRMFGVTLLGASYCSFLILGVLAVIWFILQNFQIEKYVRYTIAEYVMLIVMLAEIHVLHKVQIGGGYAISLLLLCCVSIMLLFRLAFILFSEGERKCASDEELEFLT